MHSLRPWIVKTIMGVLSKGKMNSIKSGFIGEERDAVRRGVTSHFFNIDRIGL
jgi:hypothetical protein